MITTDLQHASSVTRWAHSCSRSNHFGELISPYPQPYIAKYFPIASWP